ncbi:MAG: HD domain-containing protein [Gammaproteobacteria bacterium]|nr:MAG: HD domain-containing protein [Gammaproteobacteria bacterium]UTW42722.1 HD domain-containing protein [bacterium SCSIO 12844]
MTLQLIKDKYLSLIETLNDTFFQTPDQLTDLMAHYCQKIDHMITEKLSQSIDTIQQKDIALIALGGYGRTELYPFSDLDLLVICCNDQDKAALAKRLIYLWQMPIRINISYRNIDEIKNDLQTDSTFFTSLLDCRLLYGNKQLFNLLQKLLNQHPIEHKQFLQHLYQDELDKQTKTTQNLEPNLKIDAGNLRTLHKIQWLSDYFDLDQKLFNKAQLDRLAYAHQILAKLRFGLHLIAQKNENKLYFNHQEALYKAFKYDSIYQLMQPYYQAVLTILFYFKLFILKLDKVTNQQTIKVAKIKIPTTDQTDEVLLTLLQQHAISGSTDDLPLSIYTLAETLNAKSVGQPNKPKLRNLFLSLFQYPKTIIKHLIFLHQSGRLAEYMPLFKHTIGLQQFDFFHSFSVDVHSIKIVTQTKDLIAGKYHNMMPDIQTIADNIRPEILLLSAFFHDLGKGLGGKHEVIAADKVNAYLTEENQYLNLSNDDIQLICFLVKSHLIMSHVAQKKDISDLSVIKSFATTIKDKTTLDYLYLLTICDIRSTNIKLWNHWRFSLLTTLYHTTNLYLGQPFDDLISIQADHSNKKKIAIGKINRLKNKYPLEALNNYLNLWGKRYLIHFAPSSIQWHLDCILPYLNTDGLYLFGRFNPRIKQAEIITYAKNEYYVFGPVASIATRLSLSILDARIYTSSTGATFSQYVINHQSDLASLDDEFTLSKTIDQFKTMLDDYHKNTTPIKFRKRLPKRYILKSTPKINIQVMNDTQLSVEIHTIDYPGILAEIVSVFDQFNLYITHAKINTLDQKVEDIFFLDTQNFSVNELSFAQLKKAIIQTIQL